MQPDNWRKVKETFLLALETKENERAQFLVGTCAGDADLKEQVEELLSVAGEADHFMEQPVLNFVPANDNSSGNIDRRFGNYRIVREIGRGGMGTVFLAERVDGSFEQQVALKIVHQILSEPEIERRFKTERQILAHLNHPNIGRLLDGGVSEAGELFLAMEHVDGMRIDDYCRTKELSLEERLKIFRKVCAAVHYAHQHLVVHRDLKPSNILVTAEGEPKLLDFGIAKLLETESTIPERTITLAAVMTPEYASPEHVQGAAITTASDVYSLGVLLYELLTGQKPYKIENPTPIEISRVIAECEPAKPSAAIENQKSQTRNQRSLRGDLDNIVLKALRKEPDRRYASVAAFSDDIGRYLEGRPVTARKDSFSYRAVKFIRRNKVGVTASALVLLAVVSGLIISMREAENARRQRDVAQRINTFLQQMLSFSNQSVTSVVPVGQPRDVTVNEMLDQIAPQIEAQLSDQPYVRAQVLRTIGNAYASQGRYQAAEKNFRAALNAQRRLNGEENAEAAATMVELGVLSYREGELEESARLLKKAAAFYRKQQQTKPQLFNPANLALALDYLGIVRFYQGDTKASFALLNEAYELCSKANLKGSDRRVASFNKSDFGGALLFLGDRKKAEALLRDAAAEYLQSSNQPPWELGSTLLMQGVAGLLREQPDEAEKYFLESEQVLRRTLGDKSSYLATALDGQAMVRLQKGDLHRAEELARQALSMVQTLFAADNFWCATPLHVLGAVLMQAGQPRESEDCYRRALAIYEQKANKAYSSIAELKIQLSESLVAQNRLGEAEQSAVEARDDLRRHLDDRDPLLKSATRNLGAIYEKEGKGNLATSLAQEMTQ